MPAFDAQDFADWSCGEWLDGLPSQIDGVSTDTRKLTQGNIYFALKGPSFDGHDFVGDAFERGASACVVASGRMEGKAVAGPVLSVPDTLEALQKIAASYLARLAIPVTAITGSAGKTTVKGMIASVMSEDRPTASTPGNWNNEIGVPLSLLAVERSHRAGVFEIGTNHPGELAPLCGMLKPVVGVITNIGPAHLEFFESIDEIAEEKATLFRSLPPEGAAVLWRDDVFYSRLRAAADCRAVSVSTTGEADYTRKGGAADAGVMDVVEQETGETVSLKLPLPGEHNAVNVLLAVGAARCSGVPWDAVKRGIETYSPLPMRWNRREIAGTRIINDAYNANPMSMRAALRTFEAEAVSGDRWLVLGDMLELGETERDEHLSIGAEVARGSWAGLVTTGRSGHTIAEGAVSSGFAEEKVTRCDDNRCVARTLSEKVAPGDAVLLKASRGIRLEEAVELFAEMQEKEQGES